MKNQIGAAYLKREKAKNRDVEPICVQHHQNKEPFVRLESGAVKRVRIKRLCD